MLTRLAHERPPRYLEDMWATILALLALVFAAMLNGCGHDCTRTLTCPSATGGAGGEGGDVQMTGGAPQGGAPEGGSGGDAGSGGDGGTGGAAQVRVVDVAAGERHACALKDDGSVWCWGHNGSGQLGDGSAADKSTPVLVPGLNAKAITAGGQSSCAISVSGTALCWGGNADGQLGNNSTNDAHSPVLVTGLADVRDIAIGFKHACAALGDGSVRCWGDNSAGQLGNNTTSPSSVPVMVQGVDAESVSVGGAVSYVGLSSCAVTSFHYLYCWGNGGFSGPFDSATPEIIHEGPTPAPIVSSVAGASSAGRFHCFSKYNGEAWCMGVNYGYELGCPSCSSVAHPVLVEGVSNVDQISSFDPHPDSGSSDGHSCAISTDKSLRCWGYGNPAVQMSALANVSGVATGARHDCAVVDESSVWCWGDNESGQLGNGSTTASAEAVQVLLP